MWCHQLIPPAPETTRPPCVWKWQAGLQRESHNYTLPCKLHVCVSWNNTLGKDNNTWDKHGSLWQNYRHDRGRQQASERPGLLWQNEPGSLFSLSLSLLTERRAPIVDLRNRIGGPVWQAALEEQGKWLQLFSLFLHINLKDDLEMCFKCRTKEMPRVATSVGRDWSNQAWSGWVAWCKPFRICSIGSY